MLINLRIVADKDGTYFVAAGEGATYRCFGAAISLKAAKSLLADIKKRPWYYVA